MPPTEGLAETGWLCPSELPAAPVTSALRQATNEQLLAEIMRRSAPSDRQLFNAGGDDVAAVSDIYGDE